MQTIIDKIEKVLERNTAHGCWTFDEMETCELAEEIYSLILEYRKPNEEQKINIQFGIFWNKYDKKVGDKNKLEKKWAKFSNDTRIAIMEHLELYINATPEKQYRKNPQTYFNNESWKDEIIKAGNKSAMQTNWEEFERSL